MGCTKMLERRVVDNRVSGIAPTVQIARDTFFCGFLGFTTVNLYRWSHSLLFQARANYFADGRVIRFLGPKTGTAGGVVLSVASCLAYYTALRLRQLATPPM